MHRITKPDDLLIAEVNQLRIDQPHASTSQIIKALGTHRTRLEKLAKDGHITLPAKQSQSIGATRSAKMARAAGRIFTI